MCGVPVHSAELYLHRLIRKGFKVAICEQLEDPAEARRRGGKPLVRRDVVRIVTAGTLTEDGLLERAPQQLAGRGGAQAAASSASPGSTSRPARSLTEPVARGGAAGRTGARWAPARSCCRDRLAGRARAACGARPATAVTPLRRRELRQHRRPSGACARRSRSPRWTASAPSARAELAAAGALLGYLELTQKGLLPRLDRPRRLEPRQRPADRPGDAAQSRAARQPRRRAATARCWRRSTAPSPMPAARLLAERLAAPLARADAIRAPARPGREPDRRRRALRASCARALRRCPDLGGRSGAWRSARGGPRDLLAVAARAGRAADSLREARRATSRRSARSPTALDAVGGAGRQPAAEPRGRRRRCWRATAASCAAGRVAGARRAAPAARPEPPPHRGAGGALPARDRHRLAQDPAQQPARLLHRGDQRPRRRACRRVSCSGRAWPAPPATAPPSWPSSRAGSPPPPSGRWLSSWSCSRSCASACWPTARPSPRRPRPWPSST